MTFAAEPLQLPALTVPRARVVMYGNLAVQTFISLVLATTTLSFAKVRPVPSGMATVVVCGIQVVHSRAASRNLRPPGWSILLGAQGVIAVVACLFLGPENCTLLWYVGASAMLLMPRSGVWMAGASLFIWEGVANYSLHVTEGVPLGDRIFSWNIVYLLAIGALGMAAPVAAARLVREVIATYASRVDMASAAVGTDRMRMARDLHDVLGQTLSAIALKAELAGRLHRSDAVAAGRQIDEIASLARNAITDMRDVTRAARPTSFADECHGAMRLLAAVGIRFERHFAGRLFPGELDELFAWALREGVTNLLRHSDATTVQMSVVSSPLWRLTIVNDGARPPSAHGNGLTGLADRAAAVGAAVATSYENGTFILNVEALGVQA
jgi:two-component system, NarL family, sensor histidine kinase DesK